MKNIFKKKSQQNEQAIQIMNQIEEGAVLERFKVKVMTLNYLKNADNIEQMELIQKYDLDDVYVEVTQKDDPENPKLFDGCYIRLANFGIQIYGEVEFQFDLLNMKKEEYKLFFDIKRKQITIEYKNELIILHFHYLVEYVSAHNLLKKYENVA